MTFLVNLLYNKIIKKEILDKVHKNHQVNKYLYVVWWISNRERPEPICGQQPSVEAKICSNKAKFSIIISIVEIGDKPLASLSLPLQIQKPFRGVGDK